MSFFFSETVLHIFFCHSDAFSNEFKEINSDLNENIRQVIGSQQNEFMKNINKVKDEYSKAIKETVLNDQKEFLNQIKEEFKSELIEINKDILKDTFERPDSNFTVTPNSNIKWDYSGITSTSDKVNELFQAMDVFILPSHFEGLPIAGVEAQASGLPVILSDQITEETKLIEQVEFLPIVEESITEWADSILKYKDIPRRDTYLELNKKGFSIQYTINTLLNLYN